MWRAHRRFGPSVILIVLVLGLARVVFAQAPPAIQIFMPGGTLPPRPIRFTLSRDDGRIEVVFTDTKGKFQVTGDLIRDADYIVTVESDGATYDTTVATFRIVRGTPVYTTVFLRPFTGKAKTVTGVVDARTLDPNVNKDAVAAYDAGMKALADGQTETAIGQLKRALKISPHFLRALNDLGVLYLQLNRLPEAAELFAQAVKVDESFSLARLNLGVVLHRQGKDKEAVQVLAPLYEKDRSLKGLALTYADALMGIGELAKAEQVLRAALTEPNSANATSLNANSANANTTTAASTNATSPNAGSANATSPNAVSTNASTATDNSAQVALHFKLGVLLNRQDRFDEAAAELKKAVTINDTAANAHLLLGATLLQLNRLDDAEKSLLRAYEVAGPGAGTAQMFLGQLYLMQQKPAAALKAFEQYLKDIPTAANAVQIKAEIEKLRAATKN
jgi:tetratricopeptide (TPR) repeat protein